MFENSQILTNADSKTWVEHGFKIINTNSDNYKKNLKPAVKSAKSNCNILLDESKISRD